MNIFFSAKRKSFEFKRKAHYNEFMAVKLARQLMQKDEEVDSDAGDDDQNLQLKVSSDQKSIEQDLIEGNTTYYLSKFTFNVCGRL